MLSQSTTSGSQKSPHDIEFPCIAPACLPAVHTLYIVCAQGVFLQSFIWPRGSPALASTATVQLKRSSPHTHLLLLNHLPAPKPSLPSLFWLKANARTIRLMQRIAKRVNTERQWDQSVYNQEIFNLAHGEYTSPQVSVRVMDIYLFINSKTLFKYVRKLPLDQQKLPVMVSRGGREGRLSVGASTFAMWQCNVGRSCTGSGIATCTEMEFLIGNSHDVILVVEDISQPHPSEYCAQTSCFTDAHELPSGEDGADEGSTEVLCGRGQESAGCVPGWVHVRGNPCSEAAIEMDLHSK